MTKFRETKEWLYDVYVNQLKSTIIIAKELHLCDETVRYWLRKYGISIRSQSMANKLHIKRIGGTHTKEVREKISKTLQGQFFSEERRKKISAGNQGCTLDEWNGYTSFEPYCPKFNFVLKEEIRNRDNRVCTLCGKSELLNGRRLSVHHIDGDKMQGCDKSWYLTTLCRSCNGKKDTVEKEFFIVSNLESIF